MSAEILQNATSVVVVDWPTKDVPDSLARAGLEVSVHGGPEPDNWSVQAVDGHGEVIGRGTGIAPAHADIVYSFRPLNELAEILAMADQVGAKTVWLQSGKDADGKSDPKGCWFSDEDRSVARAAVEDAGFAYVDQPYIGDAARSLS